VRVNFVDGDLFDAARLLLERCSHSVKYLKVPQSLLVPSLDRLPLFPALRHLEIFDASRDNDGPTLLMQRLQCSVLESLDCSTASFSFPLSDVALSFPLLRSLKTTKFLKHDPVKLEGLERLKTLVVPAGSYPDVSLLSLMLTQREPSVQSFKTVLTSLLQNLPQSVGLNVRVKSFSFFDIRILHILKLLLFGFQLSSAC
jgi:hypothetical protein